MIKEIDIINKVMYNIGASPESTVRVSWVHTPTSPTSKETSATLLSIYILKRVKRILKSIYNIVKGRKHKITQKYMKVKNELFKKAISIMKKIFTIK